MNIQGNVVGEDQVNYFNNSQQTFNITSPDKFVDELQKLKYTVEQLKSQSNVDPTTIRRMDLAKADIEDALEEAKKEKPAAERIKNTLDDAKEVMDKVGGSVTSAINLGVTLGNLALLALKLFGN